MTSTPCGPTQDSTVPPGPPETDDDGGGDRRNEHKLLLMYALSFFIWARIPPLAGRTGLPLAYVQTLLEELEEAGMIRLGYKAWPRWMHVLERIIYRRKPVIGHDLTAALTEEGNAHPRLVKLKEEDETERRENLPLSRSQKLFVFGMFVFGISGILIGSVVVDAALDTLL